MGWFGEKKIGILDPEGLQKNPLTGKRGYSDTYKYWSIEGENPWSKYPVYLSGAERLINIIRENRVMIFESGTGSGKTVLIPKFTLHALGYKGKVIVTVPKQKLASGHARRDADWMDVTLGEEVGFRHRFAQLTEEEAEKKGNAKPFSPNTKLLFATGGTLVQMLNEEPSLREYSAVIIDEAHERGVDIDETLLYMRQALRLNTKLKLIIMSATLPNRDLFLNYFREFDPYHETLSGVSNYPVEIFDSDEDFLKKKDVVQESVRILFEEIIPRGDDDGVLIFVNSDGMGKEIRDEIIARDPSIFTGILTKDTKQYDLDLMKESDIYLEHDEPGTGRKIPEEGWSRKVIMATNVAESSVTLKGLSYVIDNGMEIKSDFDGDRQKEILRTQIITKAQATQRAGRVGREGPGICYRLYTRDTFEEMEDSQEVSIMREDMTNNFIQYLTSPKIKDLLGLLRFVGDLIEHPSKDNTVAAIRNLLALNIVTHFDESGSGTLTAEGKIIATVKREGKLDDIYITRAILLGRYFRCEEILFIIAAIVTSIKGGINDFFLGTQGRSWNERREESIKYFQHPYGDLFSLYKIIVKYNSVVQRKTKSEISKWCKNNFLKEGVLKRILEKSIEINTNRGVRRALDKVEQMSHEYNFKNCEEAALFSLLKGYFPHLCRREAKSEKYRNFYPKIPTTASFDSQKSNSYLSKPYTAPSKLPTYMFYVKNFGMDKRTTFVLCNAVSRDMVRLLQPRELNTLTGLRI